MTNPVNVASSAFNVERVRAAMLEGVRIPPALLQRALDKTAEKLDAKKTLFFTHRGEVVEKVDVEDHATQLAAIEKVLGVAGVYARERDAVGTPPSVALEMDTKTGIVRLVIGSAPLADARPAIVNGDASVLQLELPPGENLASGLPDSPASVLTSQEEDTPQVVKVKRGNLPADVHKALFGD